VSLIDTHAHLNDPKFASDIDEVVARANAAGVDWIIVCGYDVESSRAAVELAARFECVYATVGVHPHDAKTYHAGVEGAIEQLSRASKVLAIGEIGLDFHYDFSSRPDQLAAFEAQADMAAKLGLPIVVHSRESNDEALEVMQSRAGNIKGCVFHCFSGDADFARAVLDMGFYIGIDGPVTYPADKSGRGLSARQAACGDGLPVSDAGPAPGQAQRAGVCALCCRGGGADKGRHIRRACGGDLGKRKNAVLECGGLLIPPGIFDPSRNL